VQTEREAVIAQIEETAQQLRDAGACAEWFAGADKKVVKVRVLDNMYFVSGCITISFMPQVSETVNGPLLEILAKVSTLHNSRQYIISATCTGHWIPRYSLHRPIEARCPADWRTAMQRKRHETHSNRGSRREAFCCRSSTRQRQSARAAARRSQCQRTA